jgi:ribosomal protein L11 methyltransferase
MPAVNWNAVWESQFNPIVVDGKCTIKASFHEGLKKTRFNITIDPKMAFGTGHHQTTYMMCRALLQNEDSVRGKVVMDMGCGTAILAILAAKKGAAPITAIDIDEWCVNNSIDNLALNHIDNIKVFQGDASSLATEGPFDVIIANINRNILLADMAQYASCMHSGSELYMSGFYIEDIPVIREKAESLGMTFVHHREKNNWAAVKFTMK